MPTIIKLMLIGDGKAVRVGTPNHPGDEPDPDLRLTKG